MKFFATLAIAVAVSMESAPMKDKMIDIDINDYMTKMTPDQMQAMIGKMQAGPAEQEQVELPEDDVAIEEPKEDNLPEVPEESAEVEDEDLDEEWLKFCCNKFT